MTRLKIDIRHYEPALAAFYQAAGFRPSQAGVMCVDRAARRTLKPTGDSRDSARPDRQGKGIGGQLLRHLETLTDGRILIGTWADAVWAIRFYQAHGYTLIPQHETARVLDTYWKIPPRQVETSVVLMRG